MRRILIANRSERISLACDIDLEAIAEGIGYPLLVKAAAGGGGIGMRRVDSAQTLTKTVAATQTMPAEQIEALLGELVGRHLRRADVTAGLLRDVSAAEILVITERLGTLDRRVAQLVLIKRVDLKPGWVVVQLSQIGVANTVGCRADQINPAGLTIEAPFQMRRRGVELKLHLGDAPSEVDLTLVQNIVKAQRWLGMILEGQTFTEIAKAEGTSKRRIQDVVDLALLAPETLKAISEGTQPQGLTSDYLIKTGVPANWTAQQDQFAAL